MNEQRPKVGMGIIVTKDNKVLFSKEKVLMVKADGVFSEVHFPHLLQRR